MSGVARILKYPLTLGVATRTPPGRISHFGVDPHEDVCVWVEVARGAEDLLLREYMVVGTGHPIGDPWFSTGRGFVDGEFVWHLVMRAIEGGES